MKVRIAIRSGLLLSVVLLSCAAQGQTPVGSTVTLDQALRIALQSNHAVIAARSSVLQSQAQEVSANVRPNPQLSTDWEYIPLPGLPPNTNFAGYLHNSLSGDVGLSYTVERGEKRQNRLLAAKDNTAVTRSQVADTERTLSGQVAQLFVNVQLAESTLDLARQDLKSFQNTVDISEAQYKAGGISENDYLKIKVQLTTFQQDVETADLARVQALSDLRQLLGYDAVAPDYDVAGSFEYRPLALTLAELQAKALANRPDLRAATQGIAAANSQFNLAKANGKQDVGVSGAYSRDGSRSAYTIGLSIPLPIFDRNQGEIARTQAAINQAREQQRSVSGQVGTDVRDAWEAMQSSERVVKMYQSGNLEAAQRSLEISEYAYRRGAVPLIDFLDAERNYRATQLAWRQAIAAWLLAVEQARQAAGTRILP